MKVPLATRVDGEVETEAAVELGMIVDGILTKATVEMSNRFAENTPVLE